MRAIRLLFAALAMTGLLALTAPAQLVKTYKPIRAGCCLLFQAQRFTHELTDFNQLSRYHADDLRLEAAPAVAGRVVFMGDSITDIWSLAKSFPGKPYVNRGISGQTTAQMLVRMFPDVIDLHPAAVIILGGTNDIAGNTGAQTARMVEQNLQAMTELAAGHHIHVILCSLTPVSNYVGVVQTTSRPPADILRLNRWIQGYARRAGAVYCDYYHAVVDAHGFFRRGYSLDGLHPNAKGFALLAPVAEQCIQRALQR
ncbi:MAG: SGNH/GDSL hydrolase family protein [Terriglobales bacterium]